MQQNPPRYYQPVQYPVRREIIASPINNIFIPNHMGDHRGPIISIPPANGARFLTSNVVQSYAIGNQVIQQNRLMQRPVQQRPIPQ